MPVPFHPSCAYQEVDSQMLQPTERLAAWQETGLLPMAAEPFDDDGRRRFRIRVRRLSGSTGRFSDLAATPMTLCRAGRHFSRDSLDMVSLTLILGADVHHQFGASGRSSVVQHGQMLLKDFSQSAAASWQTTLHRGLNLHLPRFSVEAALGDKITRLHGATLPSDGLSSMLKTQLIGLAKFAPGLNTSSRAAALGATIELAMSVLRCEFGAGVEDEVNNAGLFAAAQVFVKRHFMSPRLSPKLIARQLGCSRAHLYRVFAQQGETVAHYIREVRLHRARDLLADEAVANHRIGDLAYRCGFEDPVHFTRLFRQRFGLTPSAFRGKLRDRITSE